ncbi:hypothetical protein [Adhaeribacter soli]|uniref:Uncharacterized protein n=1 Tax=Adhaeribacter soli TaxID=2607655 RepID=A0A5N1IQ44_9BACT|nr:hypothetical protein [Adhaeribacter soli]KAA9331997.1 hypothetical protein F0P94_14485 [Adhaeribacter soli]
MTKAFSLFLLVFSLAITQGFSQATSNPAPTETRDQERKTEPQKLEASLSPAEQAERDMLVPRKYQEQLAIEASKPIKYGPANGTRKTYHKKSSSRKKYYSRKRSTSSRRR